MSRNILLAAVTALNLTACSSPLQLLGWGYQGVERLPYMPHLTYRVVASPNGERLAYSEPAGLFVVEIGSHQPTKLAESAGPINQILWLNEGDRLAYRPSSPWPSVAPGQDKRDVVPPGPLPLMEVSVETGESSPSALEFSGATGVFSTSPDGKWVPFSRDGGVFLEEVGSGKESLLVGGDTFSSLAWAPGGAHLAYLALGERPTLVIVSVPSGETVRIEETGVDFKRVAPEWNCYPDEEKFFWAPDGQTVSTVNNATRDSFRIRTFRLDGSQQSERTIDVSDPADDRRYADCYHPSPDGQYILALKSSGQGGIPEPGHSLLSISTSDGAWADVAPPSMFRTWIGTTGRFVFSNHHGPTAGNNFYLGDAGAKFKK